MSDLWKDPTLLGWAGLISLGLFLITLAALPPVVAYLPADYFTRRSRSRVEIGAASWVWLVAKNLLGWVMIAAGISMLVLPGQGLLTILVGVMLVNFPGKRRAERWLVGRPRVLAALNWMRRKANRPPLQLQQEEKV